MQRSPRGVVAIFHNGGLTGPARTLAPRLVALGEKYGGLTVVIPAGGRSGPQSLPGEVIEAPYRPLHAPRGLQELLASAIRTAHESLLLFRLLAQLRPTLLVVVTTHIPAAVVAGRLRGLPILVYAAELAGRDRPHRRLLAFTNRVVIQLASRLAHGVVASSNSVVARFPRGAAIRIYPGIGALPEGDAQAFRPLGCRLCVAVVGSITWSRGQDIAVRALAELRQVEPTAALLVAGDVNVKHVDAPFRRSLDALVRELRLEDAVDFLGAVPNIEDVYAAADIVVAPTRLRESFARVPQEALVAGKPVVATTAGVSSETLENEVTALLVEPDDPSVLASAVHRLMSDPALRDRLVEQGRRRALARFDESRGVDRFALVAEDVVQRCRRPLALDR